MKIKNLLTLALCIAMCISAAACGKGGGGVSKVTGGDDDMDNTAYSGIEEYAGSTIKFATWVDHKEGEGAVPMASFAEFTGIINVSFRKSRKILESAAILLTRVAI